MLSYFLPFNSLIVSIFGSLLASTAMFFCLKFEYSGAYEDQEKDEYLPSTPKLKTPPPGVPVAGSGMKDDHTLRNVVSLEYDDSPSTKVQKKAHVKGKKKDKEKKEKEKNVVEKDKKKNKKKSESTPRKSN